MALPLPRSLGFPRERLAGPGDDGNVYTPNHRLAQIADRLWLNNVPRLSRSA